MFPEIRLSVDSILSQHARASEKTDMHVFDAGERIVMATPARYGINVEDYEGNTVEIIDRQNVSLYSSSPIKYKKIFFN